MWRACAAAARVAVRDEPRRAGVRGEPEGARDTARVGAEPSAVAPVASVEVPRHLHDVSGAALCAEVRWAAGLRVGAYAPVFAEDVQEAVGLAREAAAAALQPAAVPELAAEPAAEAPAEEPAVAHELLLQVEPLRAGRPAARQAPAVVRVQAGVEAAVLPDDVDAVRLRSLAPCDAVAVELQAVQPARAARAPQ